MWFVLYLFLLAVIAFTFSALGGLIGYRLVMKEWIWKRH